MSATFSNGQTQDVGQLAIASVTNQQALVDMGSTEYQTTAASGQASVDVDGANGRGTLEGASLGASNVNISAEFSDLIIAQRAFEANSKAMTTFDTVTQETINMIHWRAFLTGDPGDRQSPGADLDKQAFALRKSGPLTVQNPGFGPVLPVLVADHAPFQTKG